MKNLNDLTPSNQIKALRALQEIQDEIHKYMEAVEADLGRTLTKEEFTLLLGPLSKACTADYFVKKAEERLASLEGAVSKIIAIVDPELHAQINEALDAVEASGEELNVDNVLTMMYVTTGGEVS